MSDSYRRLAANAAIGTGVFGLLYSVVFAVLPRVGVSSDVTKPLYSLFLMLGGLLSTFVLVALYERTREVDRAVALWGLGVGIVAALGATIHGGYDLANAINPPASDPIGDSGLPFSFDPRGLLTFGLSGLSLFAFAWLVQRTAGFPRGLALLGYALAAFLVLIYILRLTVLDVNNPILLTAAGVTGFVLNPAWYLWLGLTLAGRRTTM